MGNMTVEDFENDGFKIYEESNKPRAKSSVLKDTKTPVKSAAPEAVSKVVIIDNKDVLDAVKDSNLALQANIKELVCALDTKKPNSFTLNIERDQYGLMKSIKVKVDN